MEAQRSMFSRLIEMPADAPVFDLTGKENNVSTWGIGKYNEKRPYIYQTELFSPTTQNARNIHIGIDLFAPVNTPLFSVADGKILHFGYNPAAGDYGYVLVLEIQLTPSLPLYALYGHLSKESIADKFPQKEMKKGEIIAWVGDKHENGGWNPHLHFQLSWERPETHDMPGTCCQENLEISLLKYPDPRLVLGPIYKD